MLFGAADSSLIAIEIGARADGWCTVYTLYIVECSPEKSPQREQLPPRPLTLNFLMHLPSRDRKRGGVKIETGRKIRRKIYFLKYLK
jgi:hypothetical protein